MIFLKSPHLSFAVLLCTLFSFAGTLYGESITIQAHPTVLRSALTLVPAGGTILSGSTFDISVYLDTRGSNVNAVELNVKFSPNTLAIVKPSSDKSLISVWLEPPTYSNTNGTSRLVGLIPNGITTSNGLVATITFKAIASGTGTISVAPTSRVLANDGVGTETNVDYGRASFTVSPVPPKGIAVYSETHPFTDLWYNNNNPVLTWEGGVATDFSYELDNKPFTIADNVPETQDTIKSYENLNDGIWYFHIKSREAGIWGESTHYPLHIDTTPPAKFSPSAELLGVEGNKRLLASFFTTDALSGIDHYEVGVIDKEAQGAISPAFIQVDSPYQFESPVSGSLRIIVRAFDKAGNVSDESVDVSTSPLAPFFKNYLNLILIFILIAFLIGMIAHYLLGHHIAARIRQIRDILRSTDIK